MMFTKYQGQELIDNTTNEWTTINGVNGYKFINKTDTAKYIFLPAGGYCDSYGHEYLLEYGRYWTSTYYGSAISHALGISSTTVWWRGDGSRYFGQSIRPVRPLEW